MNAHIKTVAETRRNKVTVYNKDGYLYLNFRLDGKRKQKALKMKDTKANRRQVEKEIIPQLQAKIALGDYNPKAKVKTRTFGYYSEFFLIEKEKNNKSFNNRLPMYHKVIEFFKNKDVKEITRLFIKRYLNTLNVKSTTKKKYLSVIREIIDLAIDDEYVIANPSLNIKLSKDKTPDIEYFEKNEVVLLLNTAKGNLKSFLNIAFNTGMRPEEILGLKFSDIKDGFVSIKRVKTQKKIVESTKTDKSKRTIPFHVNIDELIGNGSFYLFPKIDDVSSFRYEWENLLIDCKLKHRGISNTRHTYATHLLKDDLVSINELSGILGHSKVTTTFTFYASILDSHNEDLQNKLNNFGYYTVTKDTNENKVS